MTTPVISRLRPPARNDGFIPHLFNKATWIDNLVMVANVAQSYTAPSDGGSPVVKGTMLRISGNGPVWINFNGTAVAPAAGVTNGTGSLYWNLAQEFFLVSVNAGDVISIVAGGAMLISIEAYS